MNNLEIIKEKLAKYNQLHLIQFLDELTEDEKEKLLSQIGKINFDQIISLYDNRNSVSQAKGVIEPLEYVDRLKLSKEEKEEAEKIGREIIAKGKFAFVTMAGGQGTRLGHTGPKGTYMLDNKSLYEIMADSLKLAKKNYGAYIPWYIMTSRANNDDTVAFFERNNYFGYPKELVLFFKQGELPMIDENGKIILESKCKIKEAADGHGGIFEAMLKNNIVKDMKKKNIDWVFIGGIDNVLLKMVDPLLLGMAEKKRVLIASKSIVKATPQEKVGAFCKKDGRPYVIEYTEITEEMANMRDENGELLYGEAHILCNLFNIKALEAIENEKLEYHTAFKKSNYIDSLGQEIIPEKPNAYKFEAFIFDAFSKVDEMLILRSLREEEFAPVKNKEGIDSPETARMLYKEYWEKHK